MFHGCICVCMHVRMYVHARAHVCAHTYTHTEKKKRSKIREIPRQEVYRDWWLIGTEGNGKVLAPEKSISHQICNRFPFFKVYIFK